MLIYICAKLFLASLDTKDEVKHVYSLKFNRGYKSLFHPTFIHLNPFKEYTIVQGKTFKGANGLYFYRIKIKNRIILEFILFYLLFKLKSVKSSRRNI